MRKSSLHRLLHLKRFLHSIVANNCRIAFVLIAMLSIVQSAFTQDFDGGIKETQSKIFTGTTDVYTTSTTTGLPVLKSRGLNNGEEHVLQYTVQPNEQSKKITTTLDFSIHEETTKLIPTDFTASVTISIQYGSSSTSYITINKTLEIDYKKNAGTKYNGRAYFTIPDAAYVNIITTDVSGIPTIGSGTNVVNTKDVVLLEATMKIVRYFELATSITPNSFTVKTIASHPTLMVDKDDIAYVEWEIPSDKGINTLQLEWAWVEEELKSHYNDASGNFSTDLVFKNGATRVDLAFIAAGNYSIPFLYDGEGVLYVRIRPCNIKANGNRTDGVWTTTMPKNSSGNAVVSQGHEQYFNWQVTTSYAEEGKSKTVISYFDGSLRNRQTVTKDNVLKTVVASETFYDYQGRPAIQILPTPTIQNVIKYQENLNLFNGQASNATDPAEIFDLQPINTLTTYTVEPLNTTKGSANYYSTNYRDKNIEENKFIPNANGYPYTVTRYTPDATGRVMAQSGVGEHHAMGTNQVTKYYYTAPAQEELDALFGVEVGEFSHYSKNMVKDANGQASISYVDMHGRTIATALAGNAPTEPNNQQRLAPLKNQVYPNQTFSNPIKRNLLSNNTNRIKNNASIEAISNIAVSVPNTTHTFIYELNTETLRKEFPGCPTTATLCFDCMYNLEITITNDAGEHSFGVVNSLLDPPSDKKIFTYNNISLNPNPLVCTTAVPSFTGFTSNKIQFTVTLPEVGTYSVRKTLTISESSLSKYKEQYKKYLEEHCFNNLFNDIKTALLSLTNCANPTALTCETCTSQLGTEVDFTNQYITSLGYANTGAVPANILSQIIELHKAELAKCKQLCADKDNSLANIRRMMLADMKPLLGQYARGAQGININKGPLGITDIAMHNKYDIFSSSSSRVPALSVAKYKYPVSPLLTAPAGTGTSKNYYYNNLNAIDQTIHSLVSGVASYTALDVTNEASFTSVFQDSWAKSLLPYHPEYNKLLFAETELLNAYNWLSEFSNEEIMPSISGNLNVPGVSAPTGKDPFYVYVNSHPSSYPGNYFSELYNKVNGITGYGGFSMWQVAYASVKCRDVANQTACMSAAPLHPLVPTFATVYAALTTDEKTKIWAAFKALYITERTNHVNAYINDMKPFADAATTGDLLIQHNYFLHFPANQNQIIAQGDGNNGSGTGNTNNGQSWWSTGGNPPVGVDVNSTSHATDDYIAKCSSYASTWKAQLLECPTIANLTVATRDQMIHDIIYGIPASGSTPRTHGFVDVCVRGSDATNPFGATNAATTLSDQPDNFEEVLKVVFTHYLQSPSEYKTALCNPYIISWPKKRGMGPTLSKEYILASNECMRSRFIQIKNEAIAASVTVSNFTDFNSYLNSKYGEEFTQGLYNHLYNFTTGSSENLVNPEPLPRFMGCIEPFNKRCISCNDLIEHKNNFKIEFQHLGTPFNEDPTFDLNLELTELKISRNVLFAQYLNYQTGLQLNWIDYFKWAKDVSCGLVLSNTSTTTSALSPEAYMPPPLCASVTPLNENPIFLPTDPCKGIIAMAEAIAQNVYQQRMETKLYEWEKAYREKCLTAITLEKFTVDYQNKEYHYTLYYYDQAGNLVKTVPPQGVHPNYTTQFLADVKTARSNYINQGAAYIDVTATLPPRPLTPNHTLITQYRYNSLNQVVEQSTPDAGVSRFWYDALGRLIVSQNAQQKLNNAYSYTLYDALGRITEVGELPQAANSMTDAIARNIPAPTALYNWLHRQAPYAYTTGTPRQITRTVYDVSFFSGDNILCISPTNCLFKQENLRNRVSYSAVYESLNEVGTALPTQHSTATLYTYDIHGNVDVLLQDFGNSNTHPNAMNLSGGRYKKIAYNYDLISGKVNKVSYQPAETDQFYHRYFYDAENRLTNVETSLDNIYWEQDARYNYYKHGPLARTVLGKQQVQGIDYAYTIQGWLKGVNSTAISSTSSDACLDGSGKANLAITQRSEFGQPNIYTATNEIVFNPGFETIDNDNFVAEINTTLVNCQPSGGTYKNGDMGSDGATTSTVARDAYGFSLNYFRNDYQAISTLPNIQPFAAIPVNLGTLSDGIPTGRDLFNGNIGSMMVNIPKLGDANLYAYQYDQLNRIVAMNSYTGFNSAANSYPTSLTASENYKERISYDANGNILTYLRNGNAARTAMDNLTYTYKAGTNQLDKVTDAATDAAVSEYDKYKDLKQGQSNGNYTYDAIGNLIADASEGITNIEWTVYGKISKITKVKSGVTTEIFYTYDASGNRISKRISISDVEDELNLTWYVRDASGNVMAVYNKSTSHSHLMQAEIHLYGSSRLGLMNVKRDMEAGEIIEIGTSPTYTFVRGNKLFELSNHLGNVLATVTDRKIQIAETVSSITVSYYLPDLVTANDYYPFGMNMPVRNYSASNEYRYGFNGKENDKDAGEGIQDYGMRIYDVRLGKFFSEDPLTSKYSGWTPYAFAMNSPISGVDLDGLEYYYAADGRFLGREGTSDAVYKADGFTEENVTNEIDGGVCTQKKYTNPIDLKINHKDFQEAISIIRQEGDSKDPDEYKIIASIFYNHAKKDASKLISTIKKESSVYKNGEPSKRFSPHSNIVQVLSSRAGLIDQLSGGIDLSNGATQNDGNDFIAWGLNKGPFNKKGRVEDNNGSHAKFREYATIIINKEIFDKFISNLKAAHKSEKISFSDYGISGIPLVADVFTDKANFDADGNFFYNTDVKNKRKLVATATAGETIFWKIEKK